MAANSRAIRGPFGQRWPPRSRVQGLHKCCHQITNPNTAFISNLLLLHGFQTDVLTLFVIRLDQHCFIRLGVGGTHVPQTATSPTLLTRESSMYVLAFSDFSQPDPLFRLGDGEDCVRGRPRCLFALVDFTLASTFFLALEHLPESKTDKL
jgi:hypothetical protein